jgi:hypothetical protein
VFVFTLLGFSLLMFRSGRVDAVVWQVHSDTTAQAYRFLDAERNPIERLRFLESLQITAVTSKGEAGSGRIVVRTYLRLQGDTGVKSSFELWRDVIRAVRTDILGASISGHGMLGGRLDFELGRFVRLDSLGFAMIDGGALDYKTPWHVGIGLHAGVEPTELRDAITWNPYRLDGFMEERGEALVLMYGGSLFATGVGLHAFRIDAREWRDVDDNVRARQVGAAARLAFPGLGFLDVDGRYDLLGKVLADLRGRVLVPVGNLFDLEARYQRFVPLFDTASIFSVFPLYPMQELSMGVRVRPTRNMVLEVRGSLRILEDARGDVMEPGGHLGLLWMKKGRSLTCSIDHFQGESGTWDLLWVEGATPIFLDDLKARLGLTIVYVDDGVNPGLNTFGYGGHLGLSYQLSEGWQARIFVENHETRLEKHAFRGMFTLSSSFGSGAGR